MSGERTMAGRSGAERRRGEQRGERRELHVFSRIPLKNFSDPEPIDELSRPLRDRP